jgi:putative membrane-bound dehydrogenase-like protein
MPTDTDRKMNANHLHPLFFFTLALLAIMNGFVNRLHATEGQLQAGAFAKPINPKAMPVWVNGNIAGVKSDRINDPLHARSLVLSDGKSTIAICLVDSCVLPIELIDLAKDLIQARTGIPPSHTMIAATHTHSSVSVMGAHGVPIQEDYAADLPGWIAESVDLAHKRLAPAQWGTASIECDKYIYCRDWMMKQGKASSTPFSGRDGDSVSMNPGYDNPDRIAPVGTIDRMMPILSIQDLNGKPISILATFCTHYAGAPNISADYFGIVCDRLSKKLREDNPEAFVGIMSNSTSGNANCIDFSKPPVPFTYVDVGVYVADQILSAAPSVKYSKSIELDAELQSLDIAVRMPSTQEVAAAQRYIDTHFPDRLPQSLDESYARETVLMSQLPPTRKLNLQAFRLDNFVITANPCEAYNETGLKIRQHSPFDLTMNVGLANGHAGYIPPPEMFMLGGYTTWRCRTSCLEEQAEPKMVDGLKSVLHTLHTRRKQNKLSAVQAEPKSPVAPADSLHWMVMQPGFQIELAASEPNVVDPVAMQFDEHGRMWVVEMGDYPVSDDNPKSRIVVLEDKDSDGFFETSHVFAEKLLFATGVQPWQDGALVTVQGKLLMLRDRDGDLHCDSTEVWLDGFAMENPQLRANHPLLSNDGWLYIASGLRGGKITSMVPFGTKQTEPLDITNSDLRLNMIDGRLEAISGPTQFGHSIDSLGHRYGCSNRQPCFEVLSERHDLDRSPLAGLANPIHEVSPGDAASKVHPLVHAWTTSNLHAGQFTAACGVLVSQSPIFTNSKSNDSKEAHVLTCEPTGSLVQRRSVARSDGFCSVFDQPDSQEWLASRDPWFRPVDLVEGPGGDIYIVDMYRAVIEHPDWVPVELKKRPDERYGDAHGRIYRATKRETPRTKQSGVKRPRVSLAHSTDLVAELRSSESWNRNTAARLLLQEPSSRGSSRVDALRKLAQSTDLEISQATTATAVIVLGATGDLDDATIAQLLLGSAPERRTIGWNALRNQATVSKSRWLDQAVLALASKESTVDELRAAAWYVSSCDSNARASVQLKLAHACGLAVAMHSSDPYLWMAAAAACSDNLPNWLDACRIQFLERKQSTSLASATRDAMIRLASKASLQSSLEWNEIWQRRCADDLANPRAEISSQLQLAILEGLLVSGKTPLSEIVEKPLLAMAASDPDGVRQRTALSLLAASRSDAAKRLSLQMLESADPSLCRVAIKTSSAHNASELTAWMLSNFASCVPEVRNEIFASLRNNPMRLSRLVDRLESGSMSIKLLDAVQVQSLKSVTQPELSTRIANILANSVQSNRQQVIDEYTKVLGSVDSDPIRGKAIFAKNCSACHRLDSVGTVVGPDISDSREQTYDKLLIAILDPNRAIDANYFRYLARTEDGLVVEGLLRDANAQTITLQNQTGSIVVQRSELEELKSSGVSLMPEGIEVQISHQEMADLLWYIKNWRYAAEGVPAQASLIQK